MNKREVDLIATAVSIIRPDWLRTSLVTMLGNLPAHLRDRPAKDVHMALLWLAYDPQQETPRLLREAGPWWRAATQAHAEPGILTHCEHGKYGWCYDCEQPVMLATPEQVDEHVRAARRAIREAREATHVAMGAETRADGPVASDPYPTTQTAHEAARSIK